MRGRMKNIEGWRKGYKVRFLTMPRAEKCKPNPVSLYGLQRAFSRSILHTLQKQNRKRAFSCRLWSGLQQFRHLGGFGLAGFCGRFLHGWRSLLLFLPRSLSFPSLPLSFFGFCLSLHGWRLALVYAGFPLWLASAALAVKLSGVTISARRSAPLVLALSCGASARRLCWRGLVLSSFRCAAVLAFSARRWPAVQCWRGISAASGWRW